MISSKGASSAKSGVLTICLSEFSAGCALGYRGITSDMEKIKQIIVIMGAKVLFTFPIPGCGKFEFRYIVVIFFKIK
jgi:hypothetical protein